MATEGIMKTTYIPAKKFEATSTVEEIHEFNSESIVSNACGQPWLPQNRKVTKNFKCEYPSVEPNVYRIKDPLPFPDDLRVLIGWTDAFVDRIASKTQECKDIMDERRIEINRLNGVVDNLEAQILSAAAEIIKERGLTAKEKLRANKLESELRDAKYESEARKKIIENMTSAAAEKANVEADLRNKVADLKKNLDEKNKALKAQQKAFKEANKKAADAWEVEHGHHMEDEDALAKTQILLKKEQALTKSLEQQLAKIQNDLTLSEGALKASKNTNKELSSQVASLNQQIFEANQRITNLEQEVSTLQSTLKEAQNNVETASKKIEELTSENQKAKENISTLDKDLKDTTDSKNALQKTLEGTEKERDVAKSKNVKDKATISELQNKLSSDSAAYIALEASLNEVKSDRTNYKKLLETAQEELKREREGQEAEVKGLEAQVARKDREIKELKSRLIPNPQGKHVNILTVEYGSKNYTPETDRKVFDKLYGAIDDEKPFKVDNDLFGDPWYGVQKSCCITYQVAGQGAPRVLVGQEGHELTFNTE